MCVQKAVETRRHLRAAGVAVRAGYLLAAVVAVRAGYLLAAVIAAGVADLPRAVAAAGVGSLPAAVIAAGVGHLASAVIAAGVADLASAAVAAGVADLASAAVAVGVADLASAVIAAGVADPPRAVAAAGAGSLPAAVIAAGVGDPRAAVPGPGEGDRQVVSAAGTCGHAAGPTNRDGEVEVEVDRQPVIAAGVGDLQAVAAAAGVAELRAPVGVADRAGVARRHRGHHDRRDPVARLVRPAHDRCGAPEKIAEVIAPPLEAAGSAVPTELARATVALDPAGAPMTDEPIAAAKRLVRATWVRQKAAAGGDRVTMPAPVRKARGGASGRVLGRVVATSDLARAVRARGRPTPAVIGL
jgi:hypothetical protein